MDITWLPHPSNPDHWLAGYSNGKLVAEISCQVDVSGFSWILTPRDSGRVSKSKVVFLVPKMDEEAETDAAKSHLRDVAAKLLNVPGVQR